jgi:TetR/AcrR family transcriptional repressor of mexJK operon
MADDRSARKHRGIMEAATALFLRDGYQGTSMDAVAAAAEVSKQTVYAHFTDKTTLFTAIVENTLDRTGGPIRTEIAALRDTADLRTDLRDLARGYLDAVMRPQVLALRRMIIGEAARQPGPARVYYGRAPESTLAALAESFAHLDGRGLLRAPDPAVAADHFAFLVLGLPLDKALFHVGDALFARKELRAHADAGAAAFLAAYGAA